MTFGNMLRQSDDTLGNVQFSHRASLGFEAMLGFPQETRDMFSLTEFQGQSKLLHKSGGVEIHTDFYRQRRPVWLVLLKLLGVLGMVAVWFAIALPSLLEWEYPLWQAIAIATGVMVVYTAIAFFFRPEPNTDNMGGGGGLMNDPFQSSDNVNRFLWRLSCCLGPGRFTFETMLDLGVLLGLVKSDDGEVGAAAFSQLAAANSAPIGTFDATRPIAPLDPNRFAQSSANFVAGQIQLDTQRFLKPSASDGQPANV
jgi:hypothetical protein